MTWDETVTEQMVKPTATPRAGFTSAADAARFIHGGHAVLTIKSHKSGDHRTYRVSRKEADQSPWFVGLLTGPDNTADYSYLGILDERGGIRLTRASKLTADSVPVRAWNYVAKHLAAGDLPPDADILHLGKCGACGRALTHPESISLGFGPGCAERLGLG